jgi:hypothetical protein
VGTSSEVRLREEADHPHHILRHLHLRVTEDSRGRAQTTASIAGIKEGLGLRRNVPKYHSPGW